MIDLGEIVYLLGAGVNQVVKDWDDHSPPLLANFFKIALSKRKFENERFSRHMQPVYDYIEEYFKKTKDDLAKCSFDLELCFTLLERQIKRAERDNNKLGYQKLITIQFRLASFLAEVLSDFDHFALTSCTMRNFGKVIFYENPTIITFNYDCLLESILETTSGVNPDFLKSFLEPRFLLKSDLPDELLIYCHCNWNRPLGYGFKFNEIQLQQAGVNVTLGTDGAASNNDLDMLAEMHTAALIAKAVAQNASALPAEDALRMATINAAKALGLDSEIGSIEIGKSADITAIDLSGIENQPVYNPVSQLIYSAGRENVSNVWVAGNHLLKDRELTTLDEKTILEKTAYWQRKIC